MTIFDKNKQKLIHYSSSYDFNPTVVKEMTSPEILKGLVFQSYCNKNFEKVSKIKSRSQLLKSEEKHVESDKKSNADEESENAV